MACSLVGSPFRVEQRNKGVRLLKQFLRSKRQKADQHGNGEGVGGGTGGGGGGGGSGGLNPFLNQSRIHISNVQFLT